MSTPPGVRSINKFSKEYRGSFGRFRTDQSFALHYLMTTLHVEDIGQLATAGEVFDPQTSKFEELIQRDVDHSRVARIAADYLSKGHDRVVFFPPLLVCIALFNEDGSLKSQYDEVSPEGDPGDVLEKTFDRDGFQVGLYKATPDTSERRIQWGDTKIPFIEFAAYLRLNPKRAKLVVLDGQHRLEAIRLLEKTPSAKDVISTIELPVCIVWMPEAKVGQTDESLTRDFRELFVTINREPKRVSGHFILLLQDKSYSAMAIRLLADAWKKEHDSDGEWSRLHLLEWNTREQERTDQRTRPFSITTVSIVADVLQDHLFKVPGLAARLLDLGSRANDFEAIDPDFSSEGMRDVAFSVPIDAIVQEQIEKHLIGALTALLRELRPYRSLEKSTGEAFGRLQQMATKLNPSFQSLSDYLRRFIYNPDEMFENTTRGAYGEFKNWIVVPEEDRIGLLAVFQHGLLRAWIRIAQILNDEGFSLIDAARATNAALEAYAIAPPKGSGLPYLRSDLHYTRRILWRNEKVNFTEAGKVAWTDILLASLVREDVRQAAWSALPDKQFSAEERIRIEMRLNQLGLSAAGNYCDRLRQEVRREVKNNLADLIDDYHLRKHDAKDIERITTDITEQRFLEAVERFANALKLRTQDLLDAS